jgi:hypothetical protein
VAAPPSDEDIAATIARLLAARRPGGTICPSEAARALAPDEAAWRALMPEVRRVAAALARAGHVRVTRAGVAVDALAGHGPIRIGRGALDLDAS